MFQIKPENRVPTQVRAQAKKVSSTFIWKFRSILSRIVKFQLKVERK